VSETSPASGTRSAVLQELAIIPHVARVPESRPMRLMPVADSILWSPAVGGPHRPAPLMFFTQHSLRKIHDRLATVPNGLGLGLLAGRRYTDRSGAQFVVIDGALPLPVLAAEDDATDALAQGLSSAAAGIEIVGWYRSHSFSDAALTASDVEAQTELFADRGDDSLALVVVAGGEAGAVFRQSASPAWPVEALPFYEWLAEPAKSDGGPQQTTVSWQNYHASEPVTRAGVAAVGSAARERVTPPSVLFPASGVEDDDPAPQEAPSPRTRTKAFLKPAIYVACALGGAVLVAALSAIISSGDATSASRGGGANGTAIGEPGSAAYAAAVLDRRADTLSLALTAFEDRARMFDAKQMTCPGLQRGLQQVEDNWLAYNIARRETLAPFDGQREYRDRSLYADVRGVERRFERSGCPRP
jgi:hypothetical protein